MIGVNGWYSANWRSPAGIDAVGTNPLPRNGRNSSGIGALLADSTLLLDSPSATDSQVMANVTSRSSPAAPSQRSGPVSLRNPMSTATATTNARLTAVWMTLPHTWPVSTAARAMAMVRNRAMMPSAMSEATDTAVAVAVPAMVSSRMPGTT